MTSKCLDVYKNLNLQIINDAVAISPCCLYVSPTETHEINFMSDTLLSAVRHQWDSGVIPDGCQGCKRNEDSGRRSRRVDSNQWYEAHGHLNTKVELIRLDYSVGDVCNLRCAICGPDYSSAWKEELGLHILQRKQKINRTWQDLDLTTLEYIHFNGGEPLLSKEHVEFLIAVPNKSKVQIFYNTNATIKPSEKLLDLWKDFKLVQIFFSVDDVRDRFDYQRYPAKWDEVTENLKWFVDHCPVNCMFGITTTVSILNQDNLADLDNWVAENFKSNRLGDPIDHVKHPAGGLFGIGKTDKNLVLEFLTACDLRRGTDWRKTFPNLESILY